MFTFDDAIVYLRPLTEDDVTDRYLAWFRDEGVTKFLESSNLTRADVVEFLRRGKKEGGYHMYAIVMKDTDTHVGNVKIGSIDERHGVSGMSTLIGDRAVWGRGAGRDAIRIANRIAFDQYGIRKLSAGIYGENIGSIKAYTNAGWVIEGHQVGQYVVDGETRDGVLIACFNEKYFKRIDDHYVAVEQS